MNARAVSICLIVLGAAACGGGSLKLSAPTREYADYRAIRVAPSVPARLKAASLYLERHPDGVFYPEISEWFARVEHLFYEASADSVQGMQAYLSALPKGPHAPNAAQRLEAFRDTAKAEAGERLAAQAATFERRLAAAAQSREDVLTAYATWVSRLLDFDGWGRPLEQASDEFKKAWSQGSAALCAPDRCSKLLEMTYELEVGGKPQPYVCILDVSLVLSSGKVVGAVVAGPDLFARLGEAHRAEPSLSDLDSRRRAIAWATTFTSGAIERKLPGVSCGRDAAPPAVMVRECNGLRLEVFPKVSTDDDDRVVIHGPGKL